VIRSEEIDNQILSSHSHTDVCQLYLFVVNQ
jgi:hypothetical protein